MNALGITPNVEAYIQLLKNNSISFDRRRSMMEGNELEEEADEAVKRLSIAEARPPYNT